MKKLFLSLSLLLSSTAFAYFVPQEGQFAFQAKYPYWCPLVDSPYYTIETEVVGGTHISYDYRYNKGGFHSSFWTVGSWGNISIGVL